jgi:hypothetical protein
VEPLVYQGVDEEDECDEDEVDDIEPELGSSPPFKALSPLSATMPDEAALRLRALSAPEPREETKKQKKTTKKKTSRSKSKKGDDEKEERKKKKKRSKSKSLDKGKEKQSTTDTLEPSSADQQQHSMAMERRPSFRRPANVQPPARPTPPTPDDHNQLVDSDITPSCSSSIASSSSPRTSSLSSSLESSNSVHGSDDASAREGEKVDEPSTAEPSIAP